MALPPTHKIDHPIVLIHETDGAWDHDRIKYERAVIHGERQPEQGRPVPWSRWIDHPWLRYVIGLTRGDEGTVAEYLAHTAGDEGPTRFRFARMSLAHWATTRNLVEAGLDTQAKLHALRNSLASVDGLELTGGRRGEPLTEADVALLREAFGDRVLIQAGDWAIKASEELTAPEKKP